MLFGSPCGYSKTTRKHKSWRVLVSYSWTSWKTELVYGFMSVEGQLAMKPPNSSAVTTNQHTVPIWRYLEDPLFLNPFKRLQPSTLLRPRLTDPTKVFGRSRSHKGIREPKMLSGSSARRFALWEVGPGALEKGQEKNNYRHTIGCLEVFGDFLST